LRSRDHNKYADVIHRPPRDCYVHVYLYLMCSTSCLTGEALSFEKGGDVVICNYRLWESRMCDVSEAPQEARNACDCVMLE